MQYDFYILLFLEYFGSLITSCGLHNLHERSHGKKKIIARSSYGAGVIDNRIILVSSTEKKSSRVCVTENAKKFRSLLLQLFNPFKTK